MRSITELPPFYQETQYLRITEAWRLLWLNIGAFGVLLVAGSLFLAWMVFYNVILESPLVLTSLPNNLSRPVGMALLLLIIPLHEILHGMGIAYYGHRVRYGFKLSKGVVFATTDEGLFWRHQFVVVALTPLVVISVIAMVSIMFVPVGIGVWLMISAAVNAAGAVGDLWMVWVVCRYPANVLIRDEEDGMRIFMENKSER